MKNYKKLLQSSHKLNEPVSGIVELQLLKWSVNPKNSDKLRLLEFNEDPVRAWEVLQKLYTQVLKMDPLWHFLYEGDFTALRISKSSLSKVTKILNKEGVYAESRGKWGPDSQFATKEYQQVYTYLFHGFSVLVMYSADKDVGLVFDRIYHCSTNMLYHRHRAHYPGGENPLFEPSFLVDNAIKRAHYIGRMEGARQVAKSSQDHDKNPNKK